MTKEQIEARLAVLKAQRLDAQRLQYNASQMRDAEGVARLEKILEGIYFQEDKLRAKLKVVGPTKLAKLFPIGR